MERHWPQLTSISDSRLSIYHIHKAQSSVYHFAWLVIQPLKNSNRFGPNLFSACQFLSFQNFFQNIQIKISRTIFLHEFHCILMSTFKMIHLLDGYTNPMLLNCCCLICSSQSKLLQNRLNITKLLRV